MSKTQCNSIGTYILKSARLASNNTRKTVLVTVPNETSTAMRPVRKLGQKSSDREVRRFEKIKEIKLEELDYAMKF